MQNCFSLWAPALDFVGTVFVKDNVMQYCAVPENIHTPPTEGIGISWGVGGSARPKNVKKCIKLNWNFQRE